jgi:STIP1 family protein 1
MFSGNEYVAEQLKQKGNDFYKKQDYENAEACYSQAIQKNSKSPLLFTNRANARMKLERWEDVINDCLHSIELMRENMKAYFILAQAQLAINHPNEAHTSALMAYELCVNSPQQTRDAATISQLVLKAKKAKWDVRERERIRRRHDLLGELETKLEEDYKKQSFDIDERVSRGEMGKVEAEEERADIKATWQKKVEDLRTAFAISDPEHMEKREVPDWLVDGITFEIMVDRKFTLAEQQRADGQLTISLSSRGYQDWPKLRPRHYCRASQAQPYRSPHSRPPHDI